MLTPDDIRTAAMSLDQAERSRRQIGLLSLAYPGMTLDEAYAIQRAWMEVKQAAGRRIIGHKIGLTSRAMQQALNIATPDSGVLFDDMVGFAVRQMSAAACGGVWNLTVVDDSKTQNSGGSGAAMASLAMAVLPAVAVLNML